MMLIPQWSQFILNEMLKQVMDNSVLFSISGQMQRGGGGGGMGRGRGRRDNDLIGQTVRISQGPYKGRSGGGSCSDYMPSTYSLPLLN